MSQTTRCPSCATLFKVVADQLRISDGWVRCGQCKQVFDASQSLQTVVAEPLLPDLPLGQLRTPPQPVARTAEPLHNWGDEHSERSDVESIPAQAPASITPDAALSDEMAPQAPDERVLPVPEQGIPAFFAAADHVESDATDPVAEFAGPPAFAWSSVTSPTSGPEIAHADDPPALAEGEAFDGGSTSTETGKPAGYELPAAVLPEPDLDWLEEGPEPEEQELGEQEEAAAEVAAKAETDGSLRPLWSADADISAGDVPDAQHVESDTTSASNDADGLSPGPDEESDVPEGQPLEESVAGAAPEPSFVRAARRQALWRKPAVRAVLGLLVVLLTGALLLQVALQRRNYLAAAWPQWRPYLEMACAPLQCRVGAYREISSVVVDSSSFNKLRGNTYQFVITLKNRSGMELEMPAVELTLTDAGDQPVLRRVFARPDLSAPATLAAGGEWASTLPIQLAPPDSARIAGYRVLAFYP